MKVRPAAPADEAFLLKLTDQLGAFPVPRWRTPSEIAAADHIILLDALYEPVPDANLLVAEDDQGTPLGYVFTSTQEDYFTHERHAHVEVLAVETEAQGQGVGRRLMDAAESWAKSRGYRRITLNVFTQNERARQLYERLGYEPETVRYLKEL
jgi:ribosomal protein S18 acetylase RimI-like enzyme